MFYGEIWEYGNMEKYGYIWEIDRKRKKKYFFCYRSIFPFLFLGRMEYIEFPRKGSFLFSMVGNGWIAEK